MTFVQCWTNVEDGGPALYKCYTNVLCLLGCNVMQQNTCACLTSNIIYYNLMLNYANTLNIWSTLPVFYNFTFSKSTTHSKDANYNKTNITTQLIENKVHHASEQIKENLHL